MRSLDPLPRMLMLMELTGNSPSVLCRAVSGTWVLTAPFQGSLSPTPESGGPMRRHPLTRAMLACACAARTRIGIWGEGGRVRLLFECVRP